MSRTRWIGLGAWSLGLAPGLLLLIRLLGDQLGANPVEELTHESGRWALRLLLASLAVTPLRQQLGLAWLAPLRRTLGLLGFGYAALHLAVYAVLDQGLAWEFVLEDLSERPYIAAGFMSFVLLLPLAITSTRGWIRRLGRRWTRLHQLVYAAATAAVVHFVWLVKADLREPLAYASVLTALLAFRVLRAARKKLSVGTASA